MPMSKKIKKWYFICADCTSDEEYVCTNVPSVFRQEVCDNLRYEKTQASMLSCCECLPPNKYNGTHCVTESKCNCLDTMTGLERIPGEIWQDADDPCLYHKCLDNIIRNERETCDESDMCSWVSTILNRYYL